MDVRASAIGNRVLDATDGRLDDGRYVSSGQHARQQGTELIHYTVSHSRRVPELSLSDAEEASQLISASSYGRDGLKLAGCGVGFLARVETGWLA